MSTSQRSSKRTSPAGVAADETKLLAEFREAARHYVANGRLPPTMSAPVRLLIATDHELFRDTVALLRDTP